MPIKAIKTQIILLSLANPNGINPIKPPTATFVSLLFAFVKAPKKIRMNPTNIMIMPNDTKLMFSMEIV